MSVTLYGIPNCDTVKKARKWLEARNIEFQFHDFRKDGLTEQQLTLWCDALGWEKVLNKRSTSWRALDDDQKSDLNQSKAIALMVEAPTLVRRPVADHDGQYLNGFKDAEYAAFFDL